MTRSDPHAAMPIEGAESARSSDRAALVLIHGRGASAREMLAFAESLAAHGVRLLAPQAAGHTWYPQRFLAPLEANEPWLTSALAKLGEITATLEADGIRSDRIVWFGFSQGACLASEFTARNPRRWGGLVAAVGGRIGPPGTDFADPGDLARTPIYLGAGDSDPHVPWMRVEESAAAFTRQNADVTLRRYPGFPHAVPPEALEFARTRLREVLET